MALAQAVPGIPSSCSLCRNNKNNNNGDYTSNIPFLSAIGISRICVGSHSRKPNSTNISLNGRWRLSAVDTRIVQNAPSRAVVDIPVTCYQLIGVTDQAEKDEIVKSVMDLKNAEIEEGYSMDVVVSRQDLLMDVRDKLLFEPEYAGNTKEKIPPKSSLRVPWSWLPGALCLLQEVGEIKVVLDIGRVAFKHPDAEPYIHDLLLSMALAECTTAKISFEKNNVSQGFEALARAQCLLRSKKSLEELTLLSQIEESLEELAPACTLELLGISNSPENAERRQGAISALRELLKQGLEVEASCQVQDWPCFLSQALKKLMATEIIDLLPWGDLAITRKNKKSLESQNQRVVIDLNCFYMACIAHIAVGFSSQQIELISRAKNICECLTAEGIDLKLVDAFCTFLLGQGSKGEVVEQLRQLESNSNNAARYSISGRELKDASGANQLLETWLKDAVLNVFLDTRDCPPSLVNFFKREKKTPGSKNRAFLQTISTGVSHRQMPSNLLSERRDFDDSLSRMNSSQNLGTAVKQLAPIDLQSSLILDKSNNGSNVSASSVQLKRNIGMHHNKVWESWLSQASIFRKYTSVAVLGCIFFVSFRLTGMNLNRMRSSSKCIPSKINTHEDSLVWKTDSSINDNPVPTYINEDGISGSIKKALGIVATWFYSKSDAGNTQTLSPIANLSSSMRAMSRRLMPVEEAEELVKQWQETKAEALGPSHQVHSLSEVLDDPMLSQWHALADAAKARACYWKFVLLQLSVLRAEILSDGVGEESAEIEALLEEAAELVNESEQKNPSYYSTYKIRYLLKRRDDGSWRFCESDLQRS